MIDPATVMMACDAIDEGGRLVLFAVLLAFVLVVGGLTGALFLGLAIRYSVRSIVRAFAERRI